MQFEDAMVQCGRDVGALLDELLPPVSGPRGQVVEAMRYACLDGGKRLRPLLLISTAALFDAPPAGTLRAAAAVEMVHCYSLIHDDLPAMDDSDIRRGRPAVHRRFDEATAILAGDGLLSLAFAVMADPATDQDPAVRSDLVSGLAHASGPDGMVGGQMIDLSAERASLDLAGITELQQLKTGALIAYACEAGAILGRAGEADRAALAGYAGDLGLAFQITDDLLDAEGSTEAIGKPAGQDTVAGKATFVGQLGADGARRRAEGLVEGAMGRLGRFGVKAEPLRRIARFVLDRRR